MNENTDPHAEPAGSGSAMPPDALAEIKARWAREAEAERVQRDRLDKMLGIERDHDNTPAALRRDRYAPASAQQRARARLGLPPA